MGRVEESLPPRRRAQDGRFRRPWPKVATGGANQMVLPGKSATPPSTERVGRSRLLQCGSQGVRQVPVGEIPDPTGAG